MNAIEEPQRIHQVLRIFHAVPKGFWILILIGFCVLRFSTFYDQKALWIDEQISINAACGDSTLSAYSFDTLQLIRSQNIAGQHLSSAIFWANLQNDRGNALLYDYALSAWFECFGVGLAAARAFSFICFLISLFVIWKLAKLLSLESVFLMLLLLANSLLFRYSMECRTYMFTTLLALSSTWVLFSYFQSNKPHLLFLYGFFLLAAIFTHYLVVPVFIWHFSLLWVYPGVRQKTGLLITYLASAVILAALLYWLNQKTGFLERLGAANSSISAHALASEHSRPFSFLNLITGWTQVLSQAFGVSLQSLVQIRYFAITMLIPLLFFLRAIKKHGLHSYTAFYAMSGIHLCFTGLVSWISGNSTIFSLSYSVFMLPYYLLWFSGFSRNTLLKSPALTLCLKCIVILIGLWDTAVYLFLF